MRQNCKAMGRCLVVSNMRRAAVLGRTQVRPRMWLMARGRPVVMIFGARPPLPRLDACSVEEPGSWLLGQTGACVNYCPVDLVMIEYVRRSGILRHVEFDQGW